MDTDVKKREGVDKKLPDGWKWVKLGDVCNEIYRYPSFYGMEHLLSGVPVIRGEHLDDEGKISTDWSQYWFVSPEISNKFPRTILAEGDIVFTVRGTIGKVGIVRKSHIGSQISPNLIKISSANYVDSFYLWYYLKSIQGTKDKVKDNAVTVATVKAEDLENLKIPLPPLAEQKRIAAILNEQMEAVDKARKATEAQLDAAKQLPAAYLRAVFNSPEAQKWERKTLREICTGDGQYGTSELATSENIGLPILRMGNLSEGKITWNNLKYIQLPNSDEEKYKLQKGDIIFNRTNSAELVGKTAVFDDSRDAVFASYLIRFKVIETIANPNYVSVYINSSHGRRFIEANMARAIGQVNISASTMHKMPIPLPALNQQEKISQTLSNKMQSIDKLRCSLESQLEAINQLPAAIMRQAFNGKL
ncbi:restriction endonuclease subunit S [Chrysosporum bergii ANA360D]|uniref:Restriction endonuclease subunit S n=1 Tax=Chrysosporum bergii ANA360D TaxID=617107 RepID=A0AA43GSJ7_9CYAN|nr:restriction endonuclease subunit S [Chrysosporum bergii]MDH6060651.1 restriction endonuclease subunit S [Chrysosporum bergii ANA360D]